MMTGADVTIVAGMAGAAMASSGAMAVATARRVAILCRRRNRVAGVIVTTIAAGMTVADGTIAVDATMVRRRCLAGSSNRNHLARRLRRSRNRRVAVVRSLMADRVAATGIAVAIVDVATEDVTTLPRRFLAARAHPRRRHRLRRSNNADKAKVRAMAADVAVTTIAGAMTTVATTVGVTARAGVIRTEPSRT